MKRLLMIAMMAAAVAVAEEGEYVSVVTGRPVPKDGRYTVEQYKARDERVLRKTGGFIHQEAEGPQTMVVDARERPTLTVDEIARVYKLGCHLDAIVAKSPRGGTPPLAFARAKMADEKPLMLVVVVDGCDDLPALSVFPEERIGIVNADRLVGGNDPSVSEMRVGKEIWRAIGFVGGIGFSAEENDVMQPYYTLEELDANRHPFIQPMNMAKMQRMWRRFGVKKERRIPYRVAVQQGWAPAPTNGYQKAIWEEIHAVPDKPITIEFDPKKDK